MASIRLDNVSSFTDRHGKTRWRFRKKGLPTRYLPGQPGDAAFMDALEKARAGDSLIQHATVQHVRPGSVQALINTYYRSPDFKGLRPTTRKVYRRIFDKFADKYGHLNAKGMKRKHVKSILGKMEATPGAADSLLKRLKTLMRFGLDVGMIETDPTFRMKGYNKRTDGHRAWTESEVETFKDFYPTGTMERRALVLLLCTASRGGDAVAMGPGNDWNGRLRWTQSKTGDRVSIPIWPELEAEISDVPDDQPTYIVNAYGNAFSVKGFQQWFSKRVKRAGIMPELQPDGVVRGCTAHGLRKLAAVRLAEAGCTTAEIQSITGHKTAKEVARYTATRDRERAADSALAKVQSIDAVANPDIRLAKSSDKSLKTKEN
ncbi:MAG: tyrosine-type recombinase/integrase [Litorimonas sp.]